MEKIHKNMQLYSIFAHEINARIINVVNKNNTQIVLALSGGMDSRVMLHLLSRYAKTYPEHEYLVIHVHHGLSPNADAWLADCEKWTLAENLSFKALKVKLDKKGESLESAARKARYHAILQQVKPKALILTGQHANDQSETFLLALKRGSGPMGLAAMPSCRALGHAFLLRPLLTVSQNQIRSYANENDLNWVEDESNLDTRFDRNFIRNMWLPIAESRWAGFSQAINRSAQLCAEQEALLDVLLTSYDEKIIKEDASFCLLEYHQHPLQVQSALLRRWLKKKFAIAPSLAQFMQIQTTIIDAAEDANPILRMGQWQIRRFRQRLYLIPIFNDVADWQGILTENVELKLPENIGVIGIYTGFDEKKLKKGLSLKKPSSKTLIHVRFEPEGLEAHPVGRQGKRKLKKLFQEYGVPSWQRRRIPLIFYGDDLAAVADLFVCAPFAGTDLSLHWEQTGSISKQPEDAKRRYIYP